MGQFHPAELKADIETAQIRLLGDIFPVISISLIT